MPLNRASSQAQPVTCERKWALTDQGILQEETEGAEKIQHLRFLCYLL